MCEKCLAKFYKPVPVLKIGETYVTSRHEHSLTAINKEGWACDGRYFKEGCLSGITDFNQTTGMKRFRCEECDFDLCYRPVLVFIIRETYFVSCHHHPLTTINKDNRWACDGRKFTGGCVSGITDFDQTTGMKRFKCEKCDFDLCEKCLAKYFIIPV